ncbi:hypothetical protein [Lacinutrix sp. Bg11-31]|uniref:hypothetical protein n=1 Tax=Lacinutrix sp. Bg11-31 TaxID=2057808 RepID=UPI000C301220|nr:hypothetical protein [Lacinutrix sp. Bg11-31]AUC82357.1 hypothetical protein CW733_09510 [Lacinutrix sp. Bg11-31]
MKRSLFYLCILALFFSCSSDEEENTVESQSNFYGLEVGNSWNYKIYQRNSQTQTLEYYGVDQDISVVGTENLFGNIYYKIKVVTSGVENNSFDTPNGEVFQYRRIEGDTLLNENNFALFVNDNFTERLISEEDWGDIYHQTLEELATIEVDAGEFICAEMLEFGKNPEGEQLPGVNHIYYADGIGLISYSVSYSNASITIYKTVLNSYNIQ